MRRHRAGGGAHGLAAGALQSNHEGDLVDAIHAARGRCAAIVINPGAFTHYAWAIHDALAAFDGPIVELHLSNPNAREPWRHTSVIAPVATGSIIGFGGQGYELAIEAVARLLRPASMSSHRGCRRWMSPAARPGCAAALAAAGCDALLVTDLTNIRWLTGFTARRPGLVLAARRAASS